MGQGRHPQGRPPQGLFLPDATSGARTCGLLRDGRQHALEVVAPIIAVFVPAAVICGIACLLTRLRRATWQQHSIIISDTNPFMTNPSTLSHSGTDMPPEGSSMGKRRRCHAKANIQPCLLTDSSGSGNAARLTCAEKSLEVNRRRSEGE